jgi:hypothetical protein
MANVVPQVVAAPPTLDAKQSMYPVFVDRQVHGGGAGPACAFFKSKVVTSI